MATGSTTPDSTTTPDELGRAKPHYFDDALTAQVLRPGNTDRTHLGNIDLPAMLACMMIPMEFTCETGFVAVTNAFGHACCKRGE